jgi:excisionase family DNA binding protein
MEEFGSVLTVPEAAKRLGVNADTVRRYLRERKLLGTLIGADSGGYRIPEGEVVRMLAGLPVPGPKIQLTPKHGTGAVPIDVGSLVAWTPARGGGSIIRLLGAHRTTTILFVEEAGEEIAELREASMSAVGQVDGGDPVSR